MRPEVWVYGWGGLLRFAPLSLAVLVVAAVTDLHDWGDSLVVAAMFGVTLGVLVLTMGGPGADAARNVETIVDPDDVQILRPRRRTAVLGAALYFGGAGIFGAWLGDVSSYGLFGLALSLAYVPDTLAVRRWERAHRARLAWRRRPDRGPFRRRSPPQTPIGIRNP